MATERAFSRSASSTRSDSESMSLPSSISLTSLSFAAASFSAACFAASVARRARSVSSA
jgi:hypothetical protein